jgi:hopanoid biosynthesis associated protein HpnK
MKRLIINADDFGWSEAVTSGILRAHREGVLTSTTLMTNLDGAEQALARARQEAPRLAIGVHLNLTEGRPVGPKEAVAPLAGEDGEFRFSLAALFLAVRRSAEVRQAVAAELAAQMAWAGQHGFEPSHVDGHRHVHLHPAVLPLVIVGARACGIRAIRTTAEWRLPQIARFLPSEWGVADRVRQCLLARIARRWGVRAQTIARGMGLATTDWFFGVRATGGISAEVLRQVLRLAPEGAGEIMVHPGLVDPDSRRPGRLRESRPRELAALCDPGVRAAAEECGWTWATYKDLNHDPGA